MSVLCVSNVLLVVPIVDVAMPRNRCSIKEQPERPKILVERRTDDLSDMKNEY